MTPTAMTPTAMTPTAMTPATRYRVARDTFDRLVTLPDAERVRELAELPDAELRAEVAALLAADADPRGLEVVVDAPPARIGHYVVVRELGRGGMGVVYEALEPAPRRRVALKVLHPWLRTPGAEARARDEAQALADTHHPGIPRIYALIESPLVVPVVAVDEVVAGAPVQELGVEAPLGVLGGHRHDLDAEDPALPNTRTPGISTFTSVETSIPE